MSNRIICKHLFSSCNGSRVFYIMCTNEIWYSIFKQSAMSNWSIDYVCENVAGKSIFILFCGD